MQKLLEGTILDCESWIDNRLTSIVMQQSAPQPDPPADDPPPSDPPADPPPATDPPPSDPPAADPPSDPPAPAAKVDWREKQLAKRVAREKELQARLAVVERERDELRAGQQGTGLTEADVEQRASEKAVRLASEQTFASDVRKLAADGKAAFPDWNARVTELAQLVNQNDPVSVTAYSSLISAALETGDAAKVIHALGADLDEAQRILDLPPVRMGIELARLADREPSEPSKAPKPIRPVGGSNASHSEIRPDDPERSDTLSTAEWMRRRNAQEAESRKRA